MILNALIAVHVVLSMVGIGSGGVAMYGLLKAKMPARWTQAFLPSTAAASLTGFFFPFHGVTPAQGPRRPLFDRSDSRKPFDLSPLSPGGSGAGPLRSPP
jgi:hypothetical protein